MTLRSIRSSVLFVTLFVATFVFGPTSASAQSGDDDVWVSAPAVPVTIDRTLFDLPPAKIWQAGDPIREANPRRITNPDALTRPVPSFVPQRDPLVDLQIAVTKSTTRAFNTPGVNVPGQPFGSGFPADTVGAIGSTHYLQLINNTGGTTVQVYDKTTGATVGAPTTLAMLAPDGNLCKSTKGDPVPMFDQLANRWVLTEFVDSNAGNHLCVYISSGADPTTSTWKLYGFDTPFFPDYPKYAIWPDAYYVGSNEVGGPAAVYALPRLAMLAGNPASMIRKTTTQLPGFGFQVMAPVDLDGSTSPPAGSPGIFVRHRDDESHDPPGTAGSDKLEIFEFMADFTTPANSTLTGPSNVLVAEFESELCGLVSFECFPQPGTAMKLDPLREPVMHRPAYRNLGTHQAIVLNLTTDVDGGAANRGGIRWVELRRSAGTASGGWVLHQEGTVSAADGLSRWMGSIAMDKTGNIALGYSTTGPGAGQFPSMAYSGRETGDPTGTMPAGETVIIAGGAAQTAFNRWGDYSAMTIDPVDDCTFWYTNMYVPAGTGGLWATQVASFKFDSCGGGTPTCFALTSTHTGSGTDPVAAPSNSVGCTTGQYTAGASISLTATPDGGWSVGSWVGTNNDGSTSTSNTVTMPASPHIATVNYTQAPPPCFPLTPNHTGSGTDPIASPSFSAGCVIGSYKAGESINVTASPDGGWSVGSWSGTNNNGSTSTSNSVTMPAGPHTVTVNYVNAANELTFQFTFCGDGNNPNAEARGFITFNGSLLSNPFSSGFDIPGPEILDLSVTVSGAASGNGTFNINDFTGIAWDSNGGTLDFGKELLGQPTDDLPWGTTPSDGEAGDFNLFSLFMNEGEAGPPPTPNGFYYFILGADGGNGDIMILKSMVPGPASNGTAFCDAVAPQTSELKNLSTRADVGTGPDTAIAGFIISSGQGDGNVSDESEGGVQKCVVIRGRGPSMNVNNVSLLMDPTLTLYSGQTIIAENDDWGDQANPGDKTIIEDLGLAPPDFREAALYKCLPEGAFTAFLRGKNGGVGVGIVEVFDADDGSAIMENISTRARVGSGPLVTIGGFIIEGSAGSNRYGSTEGSGPISDQARKILVRGRGPSVGVPDGVVRLNNPRLRLYQLLEDNSNVLLEENDNWGDAPNADAISDSGQAPPDPNESAILMMLEPGVYTGIVDGVFGATGTGIIEVIDLTEPGEPTGTDTDGDRLEDSVETNTGVFLNPGNTGTDPNNPDTDGDGIKDGDEVLGTLDGLNLPGMGVSPVRKDLLLEYDWFDDELECGPHTHRPSLAAIATVNASFNVSPVTNPSGANGINVINDYGQGGLFTGGNLINDLDGVLDGNANGPDFQVHKTANFASNRNGYFHYVLLPHRYDTDSNSSGYAELPGDDLVVSLYCANSDQNVANTIVHELGHNFWLGHGGDSHCNYKPNYNSVMNYAYQFPGVDTNCTVPGDGTLNFSIGDRIPLDENNLNENNGTCGPGFPWDWNGNVTIESSVTFDVNFPASNQGPLCGGTLTTLTDYNDWANLYFGGLGDADGALPVPQEIIYEQPVPAEFR